MGRGDHLLDALVRVVADGGIAAVSVRAVAAEAGVSVAQVQYYFRTKEELVTAAYKHVAEGLLERVRALDLSGPPRDALRRVLHVWLPVDEARSRDAKVWLTFAAAAPVSPAIGPLSAEMDGDLKRWLAGFLGEAQRAGALDPALDPDIEAALILAVQDGLVVQALVLPEQERAALVVAAMDTYLDRLFAGR
ncbi:TetR/AcrR family transcriptional regulator [Dactylosporangium sp. NPDC050588]|uniref:TetR/AcrR family transcriptional regulator n=1 Tax=Dactylosporangium sp. NPDC050588 TaxID=3157211 RepID=UPI003410EC43